MKDWIRRWLDIGQSSSVNAGPDFAELAATAVTTLAQAQRDHISDLRVLIDKGHEREGQLAEMVKLAMEHQFYRPTISRSGGENKTAPAMAPEQLQDVAVFDPAEDEAMVKAQEKELSALIAEQNMVGVNKVAA